MKKQKLVESELSARKHIELMKSYLSDIQIKHILKSKTKRYIYIYTRLYMIFSLSLY